MLYIFCCIQCQLPALLAPIFLLKHHCIQWNHLVASCVSSALYGFYYTSPRLADAACSEIQTCANQNGPRLILCKQRRTWNLFSIPGPWTGCRGGETDHEGFAVRHSPGLLEAVPDTACGQISLQTCCHGPCFSKRDRGPQQRFHARSSRAYMDSSQHSDGYAYANQRQETQTRHGSSAGSSKRLDEKPTSQHVEPHGATGFRGSNAPTNLTIWFVRPNIMLHAVETKADGV